eukprot:CAMPEP_0196582096 /NCGR_PEP_ID=MMETSP1081-20130531/37462_1 /TAXON_ID=36882 /ORGANISM="Pyramimonas amylifera, Strain CCMP720" /LENGTH=272 /DNA_ID=CAMNT_0041902573 /DNA_START=114 /DNA_END=932 /DNA_ORIENTATION=-
MATTHAPGAMHMSKLAGPNVPGHIIKQHTSQCCRFCCCQPNIHWTVNNFVEEYDHNVPLSSEYWIQENASYCGRTCSFCMPGGRATTYKVFQGIPGPEPDKHAGTPIMTHEKGTTCGTNLFIFALEGISVRIPMCCNLPHLTTKDSSGKTLGKTQYLCDHCIFVPKFSVTDSINNEIYKIRPDTCCGGCCVQCKCGTTKGLRVPFYIRDPTTIEKVDDAVITDLWTGFKKECCTMQNSYKLKFPTTAPENVKATLMGSTLLIDITMYEQEQG